MCGMQDIMWDRKLSSGAMEELRRVGYRGEDTDLRGALEWLRRATGWKAFGPRLERGHGWKAQLPPWVKPECAAFPPCALSESYKAGVVCFDTAVRELKARLGLLRPNPMKEVFDRADALARATEAFLGYPDHEMLLKQKVREAYVMGAKFALASMVGADPAPETGQPVKPLHKI